MYRMLYLLEKFRNLGNYDQEHYKKKAEINGDDENSSVFEDGDHSNRSRRVSFGKNESLLFRSDTNVESLRSEAASVAESYSHGGANDVTSTQNVTGVNDGNVSTSDGSDNDEVASQAASFCDSIISDAMKEVGNSGIGHAKVDDSADGLNQQAKRMHGSKLVDQQQGSVESSIDLEYSRKNSTTSSQTGSRIQSARHRNNGNDTESPSSGIYRLEHENSVISPTNNKDVEKIGEKLDDKSDEKGDEKNLENADEGGDIEVDDAKKAVLRKVNQKHAGNKTGAFDGGSVSALGGIRGGTKDSTTGREDDVDGSESGESDHDDGDHDGDDANSQNRKKSKRKKKLKNEKILADKDLVVKGGCPCVMYCVN